MELYLLIISNHILNSVYNDFDNAIIKPSGLTMYAHIWRRSVGSESLSIITFKRVYTNRMVSSPKSNNYALQWIS